ncbi:MAG TPA: flavin reductase, partial [Ilumatobacteraceae bacterium]|nr:flavin reductase [Ilumatobacteraceae bacterium]
MADPFSSLSTSVDPAMVVVTVAHDGRRAGCLVGFHSQCSIEPLRYAVWLSKANHTYRVALLADWLGVHFLTADDHDLAERFGGATGDDTDKFAGV